jgi:hypothetical protein
VATYAISKKSHKTAWKTKETGKLGISKGGVLYIQGSSTLTAFNVL